MTETTISGYVGSKTDMLAKIRAIDVLLDLMLTRMTESLGGQNVNINEYQLDDGQMKVRTNYRSITEMEEDMKNLRKLKQQYVNQYNGRGFVLRDARGLS